MMERMRFCIDSREVQNRDLFFALKGEEHNGHAFVNQAFANGASLCIVQEEGMYNGNVMVVKDTLQTLQAMASLHLRKVAPIVIGITGSCGKTTTKEWAKDLFVKLYGADLVFASPGNRNTQTGLPLSILNGLNPNHRYAVLEMAMDHVGDIDLLSDLFHPMLSVILNVGTAHLGNTGSIKDTLEAKAEMIPNTHPNGSVILLWDDPMVRQLSDRCQNRSVWFFGQSLPKGINGVRLEKIETILDYRKGSTTMDFTFQYENEEKPVTIQIPYLLHHGFAFNMAAALCLSLSANLQAQLPELNEIKWSTPRMRFETRRFLKNWILEDMYNANWESMRYGLLLLNQLKEEHQIKSFSLVLGPIAELGAESGTIHRRIGELVNSIEPRSVYIFHGHDDALLMAKPIRCAPVHVSDQMDALIPKIAKEYLECTESVFFIKASRKFQLEAITHGLVDHASSFLNHDPHL